MKFKRGDKVTPNTTIMRGIRAVVTGVYPDNVLAYDIRFSNGEVWTYEERELDAA